jgi:hypothetical protein
MCCAVACVMLAACQSVSDAGQKPVVPRWARPSNPKAPMGRVDLNPPFRLGIHPAADELATGKDERVLLVSPLGRLRASVKPPRRLGSVGAEKGQFLPRAAAAKGPPHSITSSAVASNVVGIVRPSDLAVFRLMTNLNLVGACTGRSAGFSPLRMRST